MTPGEKLKFIIRENHIHQGMLCNESDVNASSLYRMMTGEIPINFAIMKTLRVRYKININLLFDEKPLVSKERKEAEK